MHHSGPLSTQNENKNEKKVDKETVTQELELPLFNSPQVKIDYSAPARCLIASSENSDCEYEALLQEDEEPKTETKMLKKDRKTTGRLSGATESSRNFVLAKKVRGELVYLPEGVQRLLGVKDTLNETKKQ